MGWLGAAVSAFVFVLVTPEAQVAPSAADGTVAVRITVTDASGAFVDGLAPADLELRENGKIVPIVSLHRDEGPLSVVFLLDRSGSSVVTRAVTSSIAELAVDRLAPGDRARVIGFADRVAVSPPDFTGDAAALRAAIHGQTFGNGTKFWEAVVAGADALVGRTGHRALVVISDGEDTTSRITESDAVTRLHRDGVEIHAIGMPSEQAALQLGARPNPVLKFISRDTGGSYRDWSRGVDPGPLVAQIIDRLRHSYLVEFSPLQHNGKLHDVTVRPRTSDAGVSVAVPRRFFAPRS